MGTSAPDMARVLSLIRDGEVADPASLLQACGWRSVHSENLQGLVWMPPEGGAPRNFEHAVDAAVAALISEHELLDIPAGGRVQTEIERAQ